MSTPAQRSFASGELTPALQARCDLTKYQTGAKQVRNATVMRSGGLQSKPGSVFICEVKDSTLPVRTMEYIQDGTTAYLLEFGNLYMRVIKNGAQITDVTKTITGVTQANPAVATIVAHGFTTGQEVQLATVIGMTDLNGRNVRVTSLTSNTVSFQDLAGNNLDSTGFGAYVSGGTASRVYEIVTPFATAVLPNLKSAQEVGSGVMTLVCRAHQPRELTTTGDAAWTIAIASFQPSIFPPAGLAASGGDGPAPQAYVVTSISDTTFEESYPCTPVVFGNMGTVAAPVVLTWDAVSGCSTFNVYKQNNGVYGFYGSTVELTFSDQGVGVPDLSNTPPNGIGAQLFTVDTDGPATVAYFQRRQCFANDPSGAATNAWLSRTGASRNFTISLPSQDDDSIRFTVPGRHEIRHLLDLKSLCLFTSIGEFVAMGDISGILRPTAVNLKQESSNGASNLAPLVINSTALYVQARGSVVRSFGSQIQAQGYTGDEVSIFASHLFAGYTIDAWCFQQTPDPIVWAKRSDGILLSLTYVPEQQIVGWTRHDTDGLYEDVCWVPEGTQDAVYVVVNRTINGVTKRCIERMASRIVTQSTIQDFIGMDSAQTYDGRNSDTTLTLTIGDGSDWTYNEGLSLKASRSYFTEDMVGQSFQFTDNSGRPLRFLVTQFGGDDVLYGKPHRTVPAELQNTATSSWALAVSTVAGLFHLEGKAVSVFADGYVVANPLNARFKTVITVINGKITLPGNYGVIHVGLPFSVDIETLNIDVPQGDSLATRNKLVSRLAIHMLDSRSVWAGGVPPSDDSVDNLENLTELKLRETEGQDDPNALVTDVKMLTLNSTWNSNGRVFLRQVDPLPLTVLAVVPDVAV